MKDNESQNDGSANEIAAKAGEVEGRVGETSKPRVATPPLVTTVPHDEETNTTVPHDID
jgi:hypothetical protein